MKTQDAKVVGVSRFQEELWCLRRIDQIRVKYIEFVPLDTLGWRVVEVVMGLIVLVPIVPSLDTVEIPWLSWTILVMPSCDVASS